MPLAILCRNSQKRWLRLTTGQPKGYVSCLRHAPQKNDNKTSITNDQEFVKCRMFPEEKKKSSSRKRPRKMAKCNKSPYRPREAVEKSCTWRTKPKFTPPYFHFNLWGCQEHHEIFVEDFSLNKDDQGTECVKFEEKPNKDPAKLSKKETKSHPAKHLCRWRSPFLLQFFKHVFPTDLKKCETVTHIISPL